MPDLRPMLPELFLFAWSIVVLLFGLGRKERSGDSLIYLTLVGLVITGILIPIAGYGILFKGAFVVDKFAAFFQIVFLLAAFFAVASSHELMKKLSADRGEFFALILMSTTGMMLLASTLELITLYVSLELTTIPLFVLAAYRKDQLSSSEAGLKYLILGALSSAILLYGMSFLYGQTGTTFLWIQQGMFGNDTRILIEQHQNTNTAVVIAIVMLVAGFGFKLALVPFHMWAPDVYEGAPTAITSFLSVASKGAGVVAITRVFYTALAGFSGFHEFVDWGSLVAVLAALAMIVGNITAVLQSNIKRMLAFSSIAHVGYVLVGFVAYPYGKSDPPFGPASILFYMLAYLFANMGAFACVIAFEKNYGSYQIKDYQGLSKHSPGLAIIMTLFLLSLAGIPPLAGFMAKYYVFLAGWQQFPWLVIIGLLTSVIALFYYANIIMQMYFSRGETSLTKARYDRPLLLTLILTAVGTIAVGIYPEPILRFATEAVKTFPF
jgi:NADH-quinone oxidoreductase subunit N